MLYSHESTGKFHFLERHPVYIYIFFFVKYRLCLQRSSFENNLRRVLMFMLHMFLAHSQRNAAKLFVFPLLRIRPSVCLRITNGEQLNGVSQNFLPAGGVYEILFTHSDLKTSRSKIIDTFYEDLHVFMGVYVLYIYICCTYIYVQHIYIYMYNIYICVCCTYIYVVNIYMLYIYMYNTYIYMYNIYICVCCTYIYMYNIYICVCCIYICVVHIYIYSHTTRILCVMQLFH